MGTQSDGKPERVWHLAVPEIRFGPDAIEDLGFQLESLGVDPPARGLLVTDGTIAGAGHAERVRSVLNASGYEIDVYDGAQREPTLADVDRCAEFARERESGVDFYLGLGGGSVLDTAKGARITIENGGTVDEYLAEADAERSISPSEAPLVTLPTTVGTPAQISMTAVFNDEDRETKVAVTDQAIRPEGTIADPTFTVSLPPELTAATAMDVLGPAIESYTAPPFSSRPRSTDPADRVGPAGRTPLTDSLTERAIELLSDNIRRAVNTGSDLQARSDVMLGGLFAAVAGRAAGVHLLHAAAYAVQNRYHTYHSETVGVLTPASALEYNVAGEPDRYVRVAELLGCQVDGLDAHTAAHEAKRTFVRLQRDLGVFPSGLAELTGIEGDREELEALATSTLATENRLLENMPRLLSKEALMAMFRDSLYNWEPNGP